MIRLINHLRTWNNDSGVTLVELMATAVILTFVLTSSLQLFFYCSALSEASENMVLAMEEAQGKMEEIKKHTFSDIFDDYNGTTFNLERPANATGEISVAEVGSEVAKELLQIMITVTWQNKNDREHSKDLISLIAKR